MNADYQSHVAGLWKQAVEIIRNPKAEWENIARDMSGPMRIFTHYALPLVIIGPLAMLIGSQIFGHEAYGMAFRPSLGSAVGGAIIRIVISLLALLVFTLIAEFLAPKFGGVADRVSAFKLVVYGSTAAWIAGIFDLVPSLSLFGILGLYSLYLYYSGAGPMMKVPREKALGYTAVAGLCGAALMVITLPVAAMVTGWLGLGQASAVSVAASGGKITLPGGGEIASDRVEKLSQRMKAAAEGKSPAVDAGKLATLLPETIGAYRRNSVKSAGVQGLGSGAEGEYTADGHRFTLRIADLNALGAIAGMSASLGISHSQQDSNGYDRTQSVDGKMQTEQWNNSSSSGRFGLVLADRFMIEADGSADNIDQLKAAVAAIDQDDLLDLAD